MKTSNQNDRSLSLNHYALAGEENCSFSPKKKKKKIGVYLITVLLRHFPKQHLVEGWDIKKNDDTWKSAERLKTGKDASLK